MRRFSKMALFVALCFGVAAVAGGPTDALAKKKKKRKKKDFQGAKKCDGSCHDEWQGAWLDTSHARTFLLLKPGARADAKKRAEASIKEKLLKYGGRDKAFVDSLDVANNDFTKEPLCLRCHTTGFGQPGGYDPNNKKHVYSEDMPNLASVGCEMCHSVAGGAKFRKVMKKTKGKFKLSKINNMELGYNYPARGGAGVCHRCHEHSNTPFQPTVNAKYKFNYEERKDPAKKGIHKHFKLQEEHDNANPKKFVPEQWHIEDGKLVIDSPAKLE